MNYAAILHASCVDFNGWSTVLQVSGCSFDCKGCFNKKAQNPKFGNVFNEDIYKEIINNASKSFINNVVIMGGEPLHKRNYKEVIKICRKLKKDLPDKKIVVFTGYTYPEIKDDLLRQPILETIDYLMDGKYECDNPTTKPFRGSNNQVLHTLENGVSIKQV